MKKQLLKVLFFLGTSFLVLLFMTLRQDLSFAGDTSTTLKVHMLNVGQGDSFLIQTPQKKNILIDGGPDANVLYELGEVMPFYDQAIDMMILTHPHNDHVSGLNNVLDRYDVKSVYHSGVLHTVPSYISWLDRVNTYNIDSHIIHSYQTIHIEDGVSLEFLAPLESFAGVRVENLNNASLVVRLSYNNTSFLFTGDMEEDLEEELLALDYDLSAQVLKAGHHGSNTSSTQAFLERVNPHIILISAGEGNRYHHPHHRTLRAFERRESDIYRTDKHGLVTILSDGEYLDVVTEY